MREEPAKTFSSGFAGTDAYFLQQDAELIEKLRREQEAESARTSLAAAIGIQDAAVIERLLRLGISAATVGALRVVPLVLVAWADGKLDVRERDAILDGAQDFGLNPEGMEWGLLEKWLSAPPDEHLLPAWTQYVKNACSAMNEVERKAFEENVMELARNVAEASGGFLTLRNRVSARETEILRNLREAFSSP